MARTKSLDFVSCSLRDHALQMSSSTTMESGAPQQQKDDLIIMLSGYPFYINGPDPESVKQVAEKAASILQDACGDHLVSVNRMGSSAIDGIAGTPVCDLIVELSPWPMTKTAKARMENAGYTCQGIAPHDSQDEWFWGGDGEPGHLGRVVLHTVPEGSDFVRDMKAFVEYVNSHPDAFQRYNNVKVEGAMLMSKSSEEEGRLIGYKKKKSNVCNEIKREAIEWWNTANDAEKK